MGLPTKLPAAILRGLRKEGEQHSHVRDVHPISRLSPLHPPHTRSGYECAERRHSNAERESPLLNIWGRAYFVQFLNIGDVFDLFNF